MNIIRGRVERALRVTEPYSAARQVKHGSPRRASRQRGLQIAVHNVNLRLSDTLKQRLDTLASVLRVNRSLLVRDAIDFYLGMAEQEFASNGEVMTRMVSRPRGSLR